MIIIYVRVSSRMLEKRISQLAAARNQLPRRLRLYVHLFLPQVLSEMPSQVSYQRQDKSHESRYSDLIKTNKRTR